MNPTDKISKHFTFREALWLPSWNRMGNESDGLNADVLSSLTKLFNTLDLVREYFDSPINVHVAWRPEKYNAEIGGAKNSAHMAKEPGVAAVDFDIDGWACADARRRLFGQGKLSEWGLRMEQNPGGNWIHLDNRPVAEGGTRYFKP